MEEVDQEEAEVGQKTKTVRTKISYFLKGKEEWVPQAQKEDQSLDLNQESDQEASLQ